MNYLYHITLDDYFEVIKLAKANGKKEGESMQEEFLQIMKKKGKKPLSATELTKKELITEYNSHNKSVLNVETDKKGKTTFKFNNEKT